MKRKSLIIGLVAAVLAAGSLEGCGQEVAEPTKAAVMEDGTQLVEKLEGSVPDFTEAELSDKETRVEYQELDGLGRATGMTAVLSKDSLKKKAEKPEGITTTGYHKVWYDSIPQINGNVGTYLFGHCHLLKSRLGGAKDDARNFFTGTYTLNSRNGMGQYEEMVIKCVKEGKCHVIYRVTPEYTGNNLVADGVTMEAMSMEDNGESLSFKVYVRNIQHGIHINYENGFSYAENRQTAAPVAETETKEPEEKEN